MILAYLRIVRLALLLSALLPIGIGALSGVLAGQVPDAGFWARHLLLAAASGGAALWLGTWLIRRGRPAIERLSEEQAGFLDALSARWVPLAIIVSAGTSLFLELAMIRWQGSVWEVFAFYKNFGLLSCFAGLGLGYALSRNRYLPLVLALPVLSLQMLVLIGLRHGMPESQLQSLMVTPITEQLNMGFGSPPAPMAFVAVYSFLAVTMLLTAIAFMPVGQLCGRLLERTTPLRAYGFNLLGSLFGVALMFCVSFLWTPPVIWFALGAAPLIVFLGFDRRCAGRRLAGDAGRADDSRVAGLAAARADLFAVPIARARPRQPRADRHQGRRPFLSGHSRPFARRGGGASGAEVSGQLLRVRLRADRRPGARRRRRRRHRQRRRGGVAERRGACRCDRDRSGDHAHRRRLPPRGTLRERRASAASSTTPAPSCARRRIATT